ncbi:peptide methionine sulfoxide reductase B3, chloroplastic-like isoform X4 [Rosa chinensis]|uniref:peptide methionine sulfoxide reductase B3, chloroplastic-like isoform X4 n=1 Tax=Rosa chinensis TaxID=74649 RepID=UPI001AD92D7B|nr:peptide methionine sulfoxide reductase B3, chloroplastic-like isoform X4 [Rosa chinensis]
MAAHRSLQIPATPSSAAETKSFRKTSIAPTESEFVAVAYSPSFVSLYDIAKGEEVERIRNHENFNKLFNEGRRSAAVSGTSAHQCTNLNPGSCSPGVEEAFPKPIITTSSATSNEQVDFALRIGSKCAICGGQLGYVFRGKGFAMCQKCFDASSS